MSTRTFTGACAEQESYAAPGASLFEAAFHCLSAAGQSGILVLSGRGDVLFRNARLLELWKLPAEMRSGAELLRHLLSVSREPQALTQMIETLRQDAAAVRSWHVDTLHGLSLECFSAPLPPASAPGPARLFTFRPSDRSVGPADRRLQHLVSLGESAMTVAHELRNFLIPVTAHASFASDELTWQHPAYEHIAGILRAAQRCQGLLEKILSSGRQAQEERRPQSIGAIVQGLQPLLRAALARTIELEVRVESHALRASVDAPAVEQLVLNLVLNAAKAQPGNRGRIEVSVAPRPWVNGMPAIVRLTVRDSGVGMNAGVLAHLFEPGFTTWRDGDGSGLGLIIVRDIAARLGAAISVESDEGAGTAFHVDFPAAHDILSPSPHTP